jgi:hypothetical protein
MTAPPVDYRGMLISIEARRAALVSEVEVLDKIIAQIKQLLEAQNGIPPVAASTVMPATPPTNLAHDVQPHISPDEFIGLPVIEAITKYLRMTKRPQMPKEINEALRLGGLWSGTRKSSRYLYNSVTSTLSRESQAENSNPKVVRLRDGWGLPEWRDNVELKLQ